MKKILSFVIAVFLVGCSIATVPSDYEKANYLCGNPNWINMEVVGGDNTLRKIKVVCADNSIRYAWYRVNKE